MNCCNNGRKASPRPLPRSDAPIDFVYVGETALTVIGGATGRKYHFDRKLCRLPVERRDAPSISAVPRLRRVPANAVGPKPSSG